VIQILVALVVTIAMVSVAAGYALAHPYHRVIGDPPADLPADAVTFPSESGGEIHGWLLPHRESRGVIILMHGIHATRLSMVDRARFLHAAGYSVLLFDFQAHGESPGDVISFGHLESRDAAAAVAFVRQRFPGQRIGVIGSSLGGAAALLGEGPIHVDAMVLEAVYPSMEQAVSNRLRMRMGRPGVFLAPLLTVQLKPRLGLTTADLRPVDRIDEVNCPILIVNGSRDRHTTPDQARELYDHAREPKSLWLVPGARHVDLDRVAGQQYQQRILSFLGEHVAKSDTSPRRDG
jgi:fermentation-respiration switch protein FrsA (DUF1100 family)